VGVLARLWTGIHDSSEQTILSTQPGVSQWTDGTEHRVRTIVAPIAAPWLGHQVLYLEEFLQDEPDELRRQAILELEPQGPPEAAVRVHLFSFACPGRWDHLDRRAALAKRLRRSDLVAAPGCDLVLARDGEQFIGGTIGHDCIDPRTPGEYVDYQLVIGEGLYWYHRRILRQGSDEVRNEMIGYNWFELNQAQLFTCRIDWSATGRPADLTPLQRLDLRDEGGRGRFSTPDGRTFELVLHSQDWAFMGERDALILMLREGPRAGTGGRRRKGGAGTGAGAGHAPTATSGARDGTSPLATAWSVIDSREISLDLPWLRVRCGPLVPDTDELSGALSGPARRHPPAAPG